MTGSLKASMPTVCGEFHHFLLAKLIVSCLVWCRIHCYGDLYWRLCNKDGAAIWLQWQVRRNPIGGFPTSFWAVELRREVGFCGLGMQLKFYISSCLRRKRRFGADLGETVSWGKMGTPLVRFKRTYRSGRDFSRARMVKVSTRCTSINEYVPVSLPSSRFPRWFQVFNSFSVVLDLFRVHSSTIFY